jgi:hypothetical protein
MTGVSRDLKELRAFNDPGSAVQRFTLHRVRETLTLRGFAAPVNVNA